MIKFSARNRERCAPVPRCAAARGEGAYHLTTSWLWLWLALGFVDSSLLAQEVQYNRDVRPILSDKCFACHGPDVATREADLRLDERASATEERGGYRVVSPGQVAASVLLERVTAADVSERMPPEGAFAAALTPEEVQTLRQWIAEGAEYQSHWSFSAPNRPPLPTVQNLRWAVNAIDRFVLAKLEPAGLQPAEAADGASLLRRVSLDLTGLPPTLAEIEDFEQACGQDPEAAYSAVVERLLHSPRHGEKMALHWLDAARYADTNGYFTDNERTMWPWRDWVIQAFNDNMPFDRFTIEQLAGDLLPQPTVAQRLATGFNRNHMLNNETGIIEEEFRVEYVADRVDTTSTVWMGLTVGCARCHDHKFDPISQRDYYRLFAFFNHVPESGLAGSAGNASPTMDVPAVALRQQLEQVRAALAEAQDTYAAGEAELEAAQSNWELTARDAAPSPPSDGLRLHCPLEDPSAKDPSAKDPSAKDPSAKDPAAEEPAAEDPAAESPTSDDSTPESLTSESIESAGSVAGLAAPPAMTSGMVDFAAGMLGHGARFAGDGCLTLDPPFSPSAETPFTVGVWIQASGAGCVLSQMDDVHEMRGWDLTLRKGKAVFNLVHRWNRDAIQVVTRERVPSGQWQHLAVTYDGSGKAEGVKLFVDGQRQALDISHDSLRGSILNEQPLRIGRRQASAAYSGIIDEVRLYDRRLSDAEVACLADSELLHGVLSRPSEQRDAVQQRKLRAYFLRHHAEKRLVDASRQVDRLRAEEAALVRELPTTMVMQDSEQPRQAYVLLRGEYDQHGAEVTAGVPVFLQGGSGESTGDERAVERKNRLDLARWLVEPDHPLTARVIVNRLWQQLFGTGIVKSVDDFGTQGDWPSHPDLLDWLAVEFIDSGWDVRYLLRLMVHSATYRQSSRVSNEAYVNDPENRLLARGPRGRLDAELLRDNALALAGLLVERQGGPAVKPYQPAGLWAEVSYDSEQSYLPGQGESLYRRSLYTYWKRQAPPPTMLVFDAPTRETCTVQRPRTNTPLQALALMNDPTFVEAARKLAERFVRQSDKSQQQRLVEAFRGTTGRRPEAEELELLLGLLKRQLQIYSQDPDQARALLSVGDSATDPGLDPRQWAAWTTVTSMLLCLDETITKP